MTQSLVWILLETIYHLFFCVDLADAGVSCLSNPCMNGICIDDLNSNYSCYCIDGYTGIQCQTNWDECWSAPCRNGGTCIDGIASYNCSCAEGFVGDDCETNYNECDSNPCSNNATCVDLTNGYVCSCLPGYSGEYCELDIAVCNSTEDVRCLNGGQCIEGPGFKYSCRCLPGWTGSKCEESIDECASSPCQNGGICIDGHADYMCACTFGHTGKSCEVHIEFCSENSCSNNALCVIEDNVRICYCVPDYHGERCQYQYDECQLGPRCLNGGTCIDGIDNFTCSCPPTLTGILCECLILDDGNLDCEYVSPTPVPESSNISTTTEEDILTTFYNITTTYLPTTNYTLESKTAWDITTDLTTLTEIFTIFNEVTELTTEKIETTLDDFTTTSSYYNQTTTESETSSMPELTHVTLDSDSSVTEIYKCGESCAKTTTFTTLTEFSTTTALSTYVATTEETVTSTENYTATKVTTTIDVKHDDAISPEVKHTETTTSEVIQTDTPTTEVIQTEIATPEVIHVETTTPKSIKIETTTPEVKHVETTTSSDIKHTETSDFGLGTETEGLFTDSPTTVEMRETTVNLEVTEATTQSNNLTLGYTTVLSECSDSFCNNKGSCVQTPLGFRCVCNFNFGGEFCEDRVSISSAAFAGSSYVTHKLRNDSSIHIAFTARTLVTEGQIMYVDIAPGIYVQLYLSTGLLKFKFSCGYQTMLLSELKTFLNNGFHIKIETLLDMDTTHQHCNATLRLNDTVAMSGGQFANITTLDHNYTLHLGNSPMIRTSSSLGVMPFVGCMQDLLVNGVERHIYAEAAEAVEVKECYSLPCLSSPCYNGGLCEDAGAHYTCACTNGYLGEQCETSVCERNPCQYGGTCVRYPGTGFLCLCPFGKHGLFCEYSLEITRPYLSPVTRGLSSFVMYPVTQSISSERFDLKFRFHTADMEQISLLAFIGQSGKHDSRSQHLAVTFVKGYVMLTWNMGSGPRRIFTPRPLSERRVAGHTVRVGRRGRTAWLSVDSRYNVTGNAPGSNTKMELVPHLFIGGHPSLDLRDLPHDLPLHTGWSGCVWEVGGAGGGSPAWGRGAGQCGVTQCHARACNAPNGVCVHHPATYGCICNEGWFGATCAVRYNPCDGAHNKCQGHCVLTVPGESHCDCPYGRAGRYCDEELFPTDVLFSGVRSYIKLHPRPVSSVSLAIEAEIRPVKTRGLLMYAATSSFYTALSLQGGLLEYRWTDKTTKVVSLVRSGVVVSMDQWHSVKAGRYGSRLYLWIDGAISTQNMAAHTYPHTTDNTTVTLGGEKDLSTLPFDVMSGPPESYTGCLRNLHINNILLPLEQQNIQDGVNVVDCDGTACGGERCNGGACSVVKGRATCSCGGGAAGARCRRHAPCRAAECKPPGGKCRRGACVCAAGYTGGNCTQSINITTPQFTGDSMLILTSHSADSTNNQLRDRGELPTPFDYVSMNFTTAQPDGLLLWAQMETNYIGIGLENGLFKIVWSIQHKISYEMLKDESTEKSPPSISSMLLPQAGMLADGEWHVMRMWLNSDNVTFSVDDEVTYHEYPGTSRRLERVELAVYIGGVPVDSQLPAPAIFSKNFKGCIDNLATRPTGTEILHNFTHFYSENVKSCQLFP